MPLSKNMIEVYQQLKNPKRGVIFNGGAGKGLLTFKMR